MSPLIGNCITSGLCSYACMYVTIQATIFIVSGKFDIQMILHSTQGCTLHPNQQETNPAGYNLENCGTVYWHLTDMLPIDWYNYDLLCRHTLPDYQCYVFSKIGQRIPSKVVFLVFMMLACTSKRHCRLKCTVAS